MMHQNSIVKLILACCVSGIVLLACEKTTFNTKPELEFLEADSYDLSQGDFLAFRLRVTDKEGDVTDSIWIKAFTNRCPNAIVTLPYKMPDFPEKADLDAEINIRFRVGVIDPGGAPIWNLNLCPGVDTTRFQFWIRDREGNMSDTVETDKPVLIRNN
jgi:hypothetical protein